MAEPAARPSLSGGVFRRTASQNRDEGLVQNKAVYVALALKPDGEKDALGLWIEQTERASSSGSRSSTLKIVDTILPTANSSSVGGLGMTLTSDKIRTQY